MVRAVRDHPAPLRLFATLAERTRNIRFRALCHTLPLHNPMVLAGEIAQADILLNGRLDVGVGRGHAWLKTRRTSCSTRTSSATPSASRSSRALAEDRFSFDGKYYKARRPLRSCRSRCRSRTRRSGRSGRARSGSARGRERLGRPRSAARRRRRLPRARQATTSRRGRGHAADFGYIKAVYLDEDDDSAIEEGREPCSNFIHFNVSPMDSLPRTTPEEKQTPDRRRLRVLRRRRLPEHRKPHLRAAARARDRVRRHAGDGRRAAHRALRPVPLRRVPASSATTAAPWRPRAR